MVASARLRSSISRSGACSAVANARISTLSNSWLRNSPRVSRPAAPASRRKHGVYVISRIGSSSASRISSAYIDVSGVSPVGMHHSPSRSMANTSSANFGSCPVAVSVAVETSDGGRISSKASALRSSASWQRARARVAPGPRTMVNIEPLIFVARSGSRMPSSAPMSQCGTRWCSG